ncbi:histidine phosphatase family protein [Krasilnikovia sp. MM14-A1259]|uniref:histidine phosphatase family protein n=1 Tax=Krasilnikovia sp. MM14-A1259 TaxID=3373539 RepID=UPI0038219013
MAVDIIYETHCVTADNAAGVISGWGDPELSEEGRRGAAELGARRRDAGAAAVYTSDFRRAVQTARIAFADTGTPVRTDRRLRECNYGDLNGCTVAQLDAARPGHVDVPFPGGGQSFRQVLEATAEFLDELAEQHDGGLVVVIAHSANKWALDCLLDGAVLEELVARPFVWRDGWRYRLDAAQWRAAAAARNRG